MAGEVARRQNASASRFGDQDTRTIHPTRVINPPRTEYVYVSDSNGSNNNGSPGGGTSGGGPRNWANRAANMQPRRVPVPGGVPKFLGDNHIVGYAWVVSMAIISYDEWHNNGILPRPSRLWYTSLFYGILALGGMIPVAVPLINALAIGYTIMLLWQYYSGKGQFASE